MKTAHVHGVDIEYETSGDGEPIVLIHGSNLATGLVPLAAALAESTPHLQLVRYHRRGMGGSGGRSWPISVEQEAADVLGLLDVLGLPSAHLLGYSYGGVIALEAALSVPKRVRSLTLLEPVLAEVPSAPDFLASMRPILERYAAGDMAGAVDATFSAIGGPGWPELVARTGPDALEVAARDTELFYRSEWPALTRWRLDTTRAAVTNCPVLSVVGTRSGPFFAEGRRLLHRCFARCADADIPEATHLLQLQAPRLVAAAVAGFLRHI